MVACQNGHDRQPKAPFLQPSGLKGRIQAIDGRRLKPEHVREIATKLNVSEEEVVSMKPSPQRRCLTKRAIRAAEGESGQWQDWLVDEHESQEAVLIEQDELETRRRMLDRALSVLNERVRRIFEARRLSEDPVTLEELSSEFDISRVRVRQIEVRAFEKVQDAVQKEALAQAKALRVVDA